MLDVFAMREKMLFKAYDYKEVSKHKDITIGIPRVLEFFDSMPFWTTFFKALGYNVKLSHKSNRKMYEKGLKYVASDTICFPAKLVHGHIEDLASQNVDRIFMPYVMHMPPEGTDKLSPYVCSVVMGYPMVVRNSQNPEKRAKNVVHLLWEKAKDFLQKAFTVILMATIVVWFLQSFDLHLNLVENSADSILAMIAGALVPILRPLGLGDWRICTSLISGVMAKESVISTLEILFGGAVKDALTPVAAASLLVFSLLYTPCIAAIASIRRELGRKWAVGMVIWQCMIAWVAAFAVRWLMVLFMR